MNVMHICNDFFYSSIYQQLHQHLLKQSIDSIMVVPSVRKKPHVNDNSSVVVLNCFSNIDRLFYFHKQRKLINALRNIIIERKPNVLHAHFIFSGGYACMKLGQLFNIPYVVAVRNTDVNLYLKRMVHLRKIGINVLLNARKVIFINPAYQELVINTYIPEKFRKQIWTKSIVIPNGIDGFWLNNILKKAPPRQDGLIHLITPGAINKNKNQLSVAKAAELLNKRGYNVTYTVIGEVEDTKIFSKLTRYDFVRYYHQLPKGDLIEHYRQADILVLPSKTETFGLVYAEALTQGLPVIYTKNQGFDRQCGSEEIGYGVDSLNVEDIADKICAVMQDYSRLSGICSNNCRRFDWNLISKAYIRIYSEVRS